MYEWILYALLGVTALLSIPPTLNFFRKDQLMNYSYNPLHLLNAYGAFGSVTRERYEIVVEGTHAAGEGAEATPWQEYEFKAKPGDVRRRPPQVAPYHLRLDWLMWFLPFSATIIASFIRHSLSKIEPSLSRSMMRVSGVVGRGLAPRR